MSACVRCSESLSEFRLSAGFAREQSNNPGAKSAKKITKVRHGRLRETWLTSRTLRQGSCELLAATNSSDSTTQSYLPAKNQKFDIRTENCNFPVIKTPSVVYLR